MPPNKAAQVVAESAQKEQPAPFKQYDTDELVAAFMAMQAAALGSTVDTCSKHEVTGFLYPFAYPINDRNDRFTPPQISRTIQKVP